MLPPDKRNNKMVRWIQVILSPLQWVRNLWFGEYRTGSTASAWNNLVIIPYSKYDRVIYKKAVYESLVSGNTSIPTDTTKWMLVQSNFIGLSERLLYTGQKLTLEYALNKWFGTTFRQPPSTSDIYITNNVVPIAPFRVGLTSPVSSSVGLTSSSEFVGQTAQFAAAINFTIYVPVAVYNALDSNSANRDKIFRSFADKYVAAGMVYQIQTY